MTVNELIAELTALTNRNSVAGEMVVVDDFTRRIARADVETNPVLAGADRVVLS